MTRTPGSARGAAGNGGPYRHTSQGSAYSRFRRALATGNLMIIRSAAAELPRVDLGDALSVCMAIREAEPERFERAALRWLARFAAEQARTAAEVREAAGAMAMMPTDPGVSLDVLRRLCRSRG